MVSPVPHGPVGAEQLEPCLTGAPSLVALGFKSAAEMTPYSLMCIKRNLIGTIEHSATKQYQDAKGKGGPPKVAINPGAAGNRV